MSSLTSYTFEIEGMDCASCAKTLEKGIGQMSGVSECSINFTNEKLTLVGNVQPEAVVAKVRALGYDVRDQSAPPTAVAPTAAPSFGAFMWERTDTRLALLGALLILPGLFLVEIGGLTLPWVNLFSVAALLVAGWPIARSAWAAIRISREININVLMTVAAIGAVFIGAYTEAGMVMVLFAIGEALEGYSAGRARHAIRSLLSIVPQEATLLQNGRRQPIHINQLQVGDTILVKPGERIPMDGRVRSGESAINQAPITGESMPVERSTGDTVYAGSINGHGALEIEVTAVAADNTISRIIQMVEEAQDKKAPTERFIDQFARYYTPAVMVLALLVATIPPLFFGQPFLNQGETTGWLYRALALLVVACPCALVISTPVTIVSAISNAARHGVLFKGGAHIEALSKVQAIAFDKTGTLTSGQPNVVALRSSGCVTEECIDCCDDCREMLSLAGAIEQQSEHPLAQAIVQETAVRGLDIQQYQVANVQALTGQGVTGQVDGRTVTIGSHRFFEESVAHPESVCELADADANKGYTPMMMSVDGRYRGTISVADTVRPDSIVALQQLQAAGIGHTIMLTGDNQATAQAIAAKLGVTNVQADLLPQDKLTAVAALQRKFGQVAMVGDGINDAPALATADVGIAIGGARATTQAMETADITLMNASLSKLPFAYQLSRATMTNIRANIIFAIGVKLLFLLLVILGNSNMWMAVAADVGATLLVILNGMRLLTYQDSQTAQLS